MVAGQANHPKVFMRSNVWEETPNPSSPSSPPLDEGVFPTEISNLDLVKKCKEEDEGEDAKEKKMVNGDLNDEFFDDKEKAENVKEEDTVESAERSPGVTDDSKSVELDEKSANPGPSGELSSDDDPMPVQNNS